MFIMPNLTNNESNNQDGCTVELGTGDDAPDSLKSLYKHRKLDNAELEQSNISESCLDIDNNFMRDSDNVAKCDHHMLSISTEDTVSTKSDQKNRNNINLTINKSLNTDIAQPSCHREGSARSSTVEDGIQDEIESLIDGSSVSYVNRKKPSLKKYKNALQHIIPVRPNSSGDDCPSEKAGFFSYISFQWMQPLLLRIRKQGLDADSLWRIPRSQSAEVNVKRLARLWTEELETYGVEKASLFRSMLKFVRTRLIFAGVLLLIHVLISFLSPAVVVLLILEYCQSDDENISYGILLAFTLMFTELCRSLSLNLFWAMNYETGTRLRAATLTLAYQKLLKLRSLKDKTAGQVLNMFSADSFRLMECTIVGINIISGPFSAIVSLVYLLFLIGPSIIVGFVFILMFYPFQVLTSRLWSKYRKKLVRMTDQRICLMSQILTCIKLIKMYTWEKPFAETLSRIRIKEKNMLERAAFVHSISLSFTPSIPTIAAILSVITHTCLGNNLTAAQAFTLLAVLNTVRPKINLTPASIKAIVESRVAASRFQDFLLMEEIQVNQIKSVQNNDTSIAVSFNNASFAWDLYETKENISKKNKSRLKQSKNDRKIDENTSLDQGNSSIKQETFKPVLFDICAAIPKGQLTGLCGVVGSGKSSLLFAVLHQMHLLSGSVNVNGSIAFVAQQAWIINATVKENIVFGYEWDKDRYARCLYACNLLPDLALLPADDKTEIGERGITLSGGQKQRISLARAAYSNCDIYLLDDPLAAVDNHVGNHIFKHCILNLLSKKTVIFLSNNVNEDLTGDHFYVSKFESLMHALVGIPNKVFSRWCAEARLDYSPCPTHTWARKRTVKTSSSASTPKEYLSQCDELLYIKEGKITEIGSHDELLAMSSDYAMMAASFNESSSSDISSNRDIDSGVVMGLEGWKSRSVHNLTTLVKRKRLSSQSLPDEIERHFQNPFTSPLLVSETSLSDDSTETSVQNGRLIQAEVRKTGSIQLSTFRLYIEAAGGILVTISVLLVFAIAIAGSGVSNWWLSHWLNQGSGNTSVVVGNRTVISQNISDNPDMWFYNVVHVGIIVMMLLFAFLRSIFVMKATINASISIHNQVFRRILRSTMSFFDTTPVGRIINRFSKDIDEVDIGVPIVMESLVQHMLMCLLSIAMISMVFPWFLLAVAPLGAIFVVIQQIFRVGVRELKRLDAFTMSPLYSSIAMTIHGLVTIRAFRKCEAYVERFKELVDKNSMPLFLFYSSKRWLTFRLDLLANVVILVTALMVVLFKSDIHPAFSGLAITYAIQMTGLFQYATRIAIDTESKFTSVERLEEYIKNIDVEPPDETAAVKPSADWPSKGHVTFSNVNMRYRPGLNLALKGITLDIQPQEKLGIVGRTGSGKSSLGVVLFRLVELSAGCITIDDINIADIGLDTLRSHISIIPQDPVLFVGTVRYNLDPFSDNSDEEILQALDKCHITDMIHALPAKLDTLVIENGENFSVGERQLICLVRALLRKNKILMLDEATAFIDAETDSLIQQTISESFSGCTIVTIAHRLNTVLKYDRILVMKDGKVAEFDKPSVLLSNAKSVFSSMMNACESSKLRVTHNNCMKIL